jgi:hypothetical protein
VWGTAEEWKMREQQPPEPQRIVERRRLKMVGIEGETLNLHMDDYIRLKAWKTGYKMVLFWVNLTAR